MRTELFDAELEWMRRELAKLTEEQRQWFTSPKYQLCARGRRWMLCYFPKSCGFDWENEPVPIFMWLSLTKK